MQWMARGSNGGYFEMMVGLPRTPAHYYQSLSSPSLAPNPPPLRISTCPILKKYPPLLLLSAWTSSKPPPSLFSSNLLSSGAHQVATTPMYLFSAHCSVYTDTPCIVCVLPPLSIHGSIYTSSPYLSLLPRSPTKSNCALDHFHSNCQL